MAKAIKTAQTFMDKASAFKLADSIHRRGKVLDSDIQRAAVSAICYSIIHRDSTIGAKLVECFPAGSRKGCLVAYFEQHGNFEFDTKEKALKFRDNDCDDDMSVLIQALAENPWYEAKKEVIVSVFAPENYLETVANKLEKKGFVELANEVRGTRSGYILNLIEGVDASHNDDEAAEVEPQIRAVA